VIVVASDNELIDRAAEVAHEMLAKNAQLIDETGNFPYDSVAAIRQAGLIALTAPRRYGGQGASTFVACRVLEELATGCASTALIMAMHWISLQYLGDWCLQPVDTDEVNRLENLRHRVFAAVVQDGALIASCYGEPGSGPDIFSPFTQARPSPGGWILSGRKFGTLADAATFFAAHAVVTEGPDAGSVVQFIFPRETTGVRVTRLRGFVGVRGAAPCAVEFCDCVIADADRFLPPGMFAKVNDTYPYATLFLAAPYIGIARASIDALTTHVRHRTLQGSDRALASDHAVRRTVAQLVVELESARSLVYRAALEAVAVPDANIRILNEAAKIRVADMVSHVTVKALQISGARNLMQPSPLERCARDALACAIHPPTTDQALETIGRLALGEATTTRALAPDSKFAEPSPWWWEKHQ
jgi:alkylation response protein AidB-like acyl-CoA dehydrogenase